MVKLILMLFTFLLLTACVKQEVDESKLKLTEVELVGVEYGFRAEATIYLKDIKRYKVFREIIYCRDWMIEDKLNDKIGVKFKVYDKSNTPIPNYYNLMDDFCNVDYVK